MKLKVQKRLASQILKCSPKKVSFDTERLDEIKESITRADLKGLIRDKAINKVPKKESSRSRARKIQTQKKKGKRRGHGSRKGKKSARIGSKKEWMNKIRKQRKLLKELAEKELIPRKVYRDLYMKAKGGFFRSVRHIKLYIKEKELTK